MEGSWGSEGKEDEVRRMARRVRGVFGGGECMAKFQQGSSRRGMVRSLKDSRGSSMARKKESFVTVPLTAILCRAGGRRGGTSFIFQLLIEQVGDVVTLENKKSRASFY